MSTYLSSDPFTATSLVELSVHRLGERTCVINVGTDLRHVELPVVDGYVQPDPAAGGPMRVGL